MDHSAKIGGFNGTSRDAGARFSGVFLANNPHPKEWDFLDEAAVEAMVAEVEHDLFGDESQDVGGEEALRMAIKKQKEKERVNAYDYSAPAKAVSDLDRKSNSASRSAGKMNNLVHDVPAAFAPVDVELRAAQDQALEFERAAEAAAARVAGQRCEEMVIRLRKRLHEAEGQLEAASLAHKHWQEEKRGLEDRVEDLQIETTSLREQLSSNAGAMMTGLAGNAPARGGGMSVFLQKRTTADKLKDLGAGKGFDVDVDGLEHLVGAGDLAKLEIQGSLAMLLARIDRIVKRLTPLEGDIYFVRSQYGRALGSFFDFLRFLFFLACALLVVHVPLLVSHTYEVWGTPAATKICGGVPCAATYGSFYQRDGASSGRLLLSTSGNLTATAINNTNFSNVTIITAPARNNIKSSTTTGILAAGSESTSTRDPMYALFFLATMLASAGTAAYLSLSRWALHDRLHAVEKLDEELQPRPWSRVVLVGWDFRLKTGEDRQNWRQSMINQLEGLKEDMHEKKKAQNRTKKEKRLLLLRRIAGIFLNLSLILTAWALIGTATIFEREISGSLSRSIGGQVGPQIGALAPNLILSLVGTVLPTATKMITQFEKWPRSVQEGHNLWRLYLGRIFNVGILAALNFELLVGKSIFGQQSTLITRKKDEFPCAEDQAAVNLVRLTLTEFVLSLALKPAQKSVVSRVKYWVFNPDMKFQMPEFEIADYAVDAIYFQGLLSVAMVLTPAWAVVAPILWFAHFKWLKRALEKLSSRPGVSESTSIGAQMRRLLSVTTALCVGFVYAIVSQALPHEAGCGPFEPGAAFDVSLIGLEAKGVTYAGTLSEILRSPVPFAAAAAVLFATWLFSKNHSHALRQALQNLQASSQRHCAAIENELKLLEKKNEVLQRRLENQQIYKG